MRTIDADALIYGLRDYTFTLNPDDPNATKEYSLVSKMIEILENAPTIESRKNGEWIKHIDDLFPTESTIECNVCHHEQPLTIDDNYCPNCGLKLKYHMFRR